MSSTLAPPFAGATRRRASYAGARSCIPWVSTSASTSAGPAALSVTRTGSRKARSLVYTSAGTSPSVGAVLSWMSATTRVRSACQPAFAPKTACSARRPRANPPRTPASKPNALGQVRSVQPAAVSTPCPSQPGAVAPVRNDVNWPLAFGAQVVQVTALLRNAVPAGA